MSLARELKLLDPAGRIIYIGLKGDKIESLKSSYHYFDEVFYISAGKFRRYHGESFWSHVVDLRTLALNIRDFFKVIVGIFEAGRLLKRIRPNVLFSKGGFVAVPVGIAARLCTVPIVTHDSDVTTGLANRIIGRWAKFHATGMPTDLYSYPKQSIRFVGIPTDERIKPVNASGQASFKKQLGLDPKQPVLLVGGAGLGSRDINNLVLEIANTLLNELSNLHIFHIAGTSHLSTVTNAYQKLPVANRSRVTVFGFTTDFYKYCGAADLVITRPGATTMAELAIASKAVLVIPASYLAGGHQSANAKSLQDLNAVKVLSGEINPQELLGAAVELLTNDAKRQRLATNLGKTAQPQASRKLAKLILEAASLRKES